MCAYLPSLLHIDRTVMKRIAPHLYCVIKILTTILTINNKKNTFHYKVPTT